MAAATIDALLHSVADAVTSLATAGRPADDASPWWCSFPEPDIP